MSEWTVQSRFVRAQIQPLGAMLGPAWFRIGTAEVQPFAVAPWSDDVGPEHVRLPGILRRLRGEWPCVPFGIERPCGDVPDEWRWSSSSPPSVEPHGHSSNVTWEATARAEDRIELALEYPSSSPIRRVQRSVFASPEKPRLELGLRIEVSETCEIPIGLHPTFRLPTTPRRARLELGPTARGWTSPIPLEPHIARFNSDIRENALEHIPTREGPEDITRLPLPYAAEEVVLVTGHGGSATLTNLDERYAASLSWDHAVFPACQLWLSNGGRTAYPWLGRFRAIGIEPVCAAFDLGTRASQNRRNPLWKAGVPCTIALSPEQPFVTRYQISVTSLG